MTSILPESTVSNARILIEQSIGRGLRLPYGKRTGVTAVLRSYDGLSTITDSTSSDERSKERAPPTATHRPRTSRRSHAA